MTRVQERNAKVLRRQPIDLNGPGTILRDFESLLDSFGTEGLRSTGKHHLLPLDQLFELDARMTRPLRPRLKRPQQRSFPHLNGLYLLLRATRLAVPKGVGKTSGRLVLDPAVLDSWRSLNFTEQYFNLLEAWLLHGREEMVGETGRGWGGAMTMQAIQVWGIVGKERLNWRKAPYAPVYGAMGYCTLALLELFGFVDVERGKPAEGENWPILAVRRTPLGEAIFDTLLTLDRILSRDLDQGAADFGAWQPILQEFFPEWRNNLQFPEPEFRDGIYFFKVQLGSPWRRIAVRADHTLDDLAWSIIKAFEFDGDHLYNFQFSERDGSNISVDHPAIDDAEIHTDEYSIGYLPLETGQSMDFLYDFGANWHFDIRLENVEPSGRRMTKPRIVESHGKAPKEYEDYDEYED